MASLGPYKRALEPKAQTLLIPGDGKPMGGMVKYDQYSRWNIKDEEFEDLLNWLPEDKSLRQVPGIGPTINTLPATVIWMWATILNGAVLIFCLCTDGNCYQVALNGVRTKINGATPLSSATDITNWQGTTIILSDVNTGGGTIYSWNGTTFSTVFTSQPASFITVYANRLWGANNSAVFFTNANTFNSLGGDSSSFTITEADCVNPVLALFPFLGQLYIFGANFIQVVGNVTDTGTPAVAILQRYTIEAQIGPINKWSIVPLGTYLYFATNYGIWQFNGSAVTKISDQVDGVFNNAKMSSSFSSGFMEIYGDPCLFWNADIAGAPVNTQSVVGLTTQGKWFRASNGTTGSLSFITSIVSSAVTANVPAIFGTDGTNLFKMFTDTTNQVTSSLSAKVFSFGDLIRLKKFLKLGIIGLSVGSSITSSLSYFDESLHQIEPTITKTISGGLLIFVGTGPIQFKGAGNVNLNFVSTTTTFEPWQYDGPGSYRGCTFNWQTQGIASPLFQLAWEIEESQAGWGS
jgi:hypothetical protein